MAILKNRPLFCASLLYIICAACAYFSSPTIKIVLICTCAVALLACGVLLLCKKKARRACIFAAALALCALLAAFSSLAAFGISMQKYQSIAQRGQCNVSATVLERTPAEHTTLLRVSVHSLDSKAQRFDAYVVCNFPSYLQVGDSFVATLEPATLEQSASPYFDYHYALADGVRMQLNCESEEQIKHTDSEHSLLPRVALHKLNNALCRILLDVCGKESGGLVCALLLGNKAFLADTLSRDFDRAGASHMLALSGLHVSILMGALSFLLAKLGIHRKVRAVLLAVAAVGYLLLTGMSVSATRAVVMVCVLQLSYLLAADNDTLTTLGLVGMGILLLDPYSICDAGFILSFLATFGIVVLVPPLHEFLRTRTEALSAPPHQKLKRRALGLGSAILETLLIGVIACFAIFVPSCYLIGNMSAFSPLTTLLLSPVVTALLVLGAIVLILSPIPPLANFFATLIRLLYAISTPYLERVSQTDGALIPLTHTAVQVAGILLCGIMLILLIVPLKRKHLLSLPPALLLLFLCIFLPMNSMVCARNLRAAYSHPSGLAETLVCAQSYRAYVCDLSSGSNNALGGAMHAMGELDATEVGAILLTDYRVQHSAMLTELLSNYKTDLVYLPRTDDADAQSIRARVLEVCATHGVRVQDYDYGQALEWYDGTFITVHLAHLSRSEQPVLTVTLERGDACISLLSAAAEHSEIGLQAKDAAARADVLIYPERGPVPRLPFAPDVSSDTELVFAGEQIAAYCDPACAKRAKRCVLAPALLEICLASTP